MGTVSSLVVSGGSSFIVTLGSCKTRSIAGAVALLLGLTFLGGCDSVEERVEKHYQQGVAWVEKGEHLKASLEFRNALSLNDKHVPALYELAKAEHRLGALAKETDRADRLRRAAGIYVRVVEAEPAHVEARVALAKLLLRAGQLDAALKYANQAFGLAPNNADVLVAKSAVALRLENTEEAVRFADAALELEPNNMDALLVRALERFVAQDPQSTLDILKRGEQIDERNFDLQSLQLLAFGAMNDAEGIEGVLKKRIQFYPEDRRFRYQLAKWYHEAKRQGEAENVLQKFASDYPENIDAGLRLVAYLKQTKGVVAAEAELAQRINSGANAIDYELALAELKFGNGSHTEAFALLEKVIANTGASPDTSRAKVLLARLKINRGNLQQAEAQLVAVLADDSKNVDALVLLASLRITQKNYAGAIELLLVAQNEEPESTEIRLSLANAYELNGSVELAEEQLSAAVRMQKFQPGIALSYAEFLLRYGKSEQAERVLSESLAVAPTNRRVLARLAELRLAEQDWLGAQEVADIMRRLPNSDNIADQIQAEVLAGQEKYEESNSLLRESLSNTASKTAPVVRYVRNLVRNGQPDGAMNFLNEILASNPKNVRARVLVGSLHELASKPKLAEASYQQAIKDDGNGVTGHQALARFYLRSDQHSDAEKILQSAIERQPDNLSVRLLLATVLESSRQIGAAIAEYESLHRAAPQSTIIANNLASLLADYSESEESLERAYAIATRFRGSNVPHFLDTLGWLHYRKGEYEQAVTLLKTASEKLEGVELVQYHLGMTYKALGQKKLAVETLNTAISLAKGKEFAQLESARKALAELGAEPSAAN